LGDPGVDGRIILRWIFRKWDVGGMDWIELVQERNKWGGGSCKGGNKPSGSIKCREFLDWLRTGWVPKKDCAAWSE